MSLRGADIPPELVRKIAVFCTEWDRDYEPTDKRGMAACSLTCQYWAHLLTPLIFRRLVLRSGEDISQLLAFVRGADDRAPPLRECVRKLELKVDRTATTIPWSHQMARLHRELPNVAFQSDVRLVVTGSGGAHGTAGGDDTFLLPFRTLPRTLPASCTMLDYVILRDLRLASTRALVDSAKTVAMRYLILDGVSFAREDLGSIVRRRMRPWSELATITATRCFAHPGIDGPFSLANLLFAGQGCMYASGDALATAEECLNLLLQYTGNAASSPWFSVNYDFGEEMRHDETYHKYKYRARCDDSAMEVRADLSVPEHSEALPIYVVTYLEFLRELPEPALAAVQWDELERKLTALVSPNCLWFYIQFPSRTAARSTLRSLLEGRILGRLCRELKRVRVVVDDFTGVDTVVRLTSAKILSAPTTVTVGSFTVSLNIEQRVEWMLRGTDRRAYLLTVARQAVSSGAALARVADEQKCMS